MQKSSAFRKVWRFATQKHLAALLLLLALLLAASPFTFQAAQAAGTVSTCDEASLTAALAGGGTVTFSCSGTITLTAGNTITIASNTVLDGSGQSVTISGNQARIFQVDAGVSFTLTNLTLANGDAVFAGFGNGGAINNNGGSVTVNNSSFLNNRGFAGGAIYNDNNGTLVVTNSTFSGNIGDSGDGNGGAISNNSGSVSITNSTFFNNTALSGGAIHNSLGLSVTLTVLNSTISGNTASSTGAGIYNDGGVVTVTNSILDSNGKSNCDGTGITDGGHNLDSAATCGFTVAALNNTSAALGALAANGGPTQTMALGAGSPAINTADTTKCPATDQRNYGRAGACDIGAYEYNGIAATPGYGSNPAPGGTLFVGTTKPGKMVSAAITVNETGTATLTVSNPVISGTDAADFIIIAPLSFPFNIVDGGAAQAITLQCKPSALGTRRATLSLNTNDPANATVSYSLRCSGSENEPRIPADLIGQLRVTPDRIVNTDPATLVTYKFTVINIGQGQADMVRLIFPLDPNLVIGYPTFSDPRLWISEIVTTGEKPYLKIGFPSIAPGQSFGGTLVFRPAAGAISGASIFTRFALGWDDSDGIGKKAGSNAVRFALSASNPSFDETGGEVQKLSLTTNNVPNGTKVKLSGDFFAPQEVVNFWFTNAEGVSQALGTAQADSEGNLSFEFVVKDWKVGETYAVAGRGARSKVVGGGVVITVIAAPTP